MKQLFGAILLVALLGTGVTTVSAAFPGANGRLAVVIDDSSQSSDNRDIWTVNPDGSDPLRLTTHPQWDLWPEWSPDGKRIVFTRHLDNLWLMNADGSEQTQLTSEPVSEWEPTWSPDGREIAFAKDFFDRGEHRSEIRILNLENGTQRTVSDPSLFSFEPSWSALGDKIAFVGFGFTNGYEIYTVNPDGSGLQALTNSNRANRFPEWSPDGSQIAFSRSRSDSFPYPGDLFMMDAAGANQRKIADNVDVPAWSPDGSKIAFMRFLFPDSAVWIRDLDSGEERRISDASSYSFLSKPDWQPIVNRPPECAGTKATPEVLLPPHRKLEPVALSGATDPDGDDVAITVAGVTQDEPLSGQTDHTSPDASVGAASNEVLLRAERSPKGDGRMYRITFSADDGRGGSCSGTAEVSVPRHTHEPAVDSSPPAYDSFSSGN